MRHALEPDHLAAVSTLVAEERGLWRAARLGLIWGLGHMLPLALLGVCALLLGLRLPAAMEDVVDLGVGVLLISLGARSLWRLFRHHPDHGDAHDHDHTHAHGQGRSSHVYPVAGQNRQGTVTFAVGCLHGLAGSGAAFVLAITAAPSVATGVGYLLAFSIGTCIGMFAMTLCIMAPLLTTVSGLASLTGAVRAAAGLACICAGAFMWYEILPHVLA